MTTTLASLFCLGPTSDLSSRALVVAEATYFVGQRLGADVEARFLRGLGSFDVEGPVPEDFERIAELVEQYADFPLGGTDASVIALAERVGATVVIMLDRRISARLSHGMRVLSNCSRRGRPAVRLGDRAPRQQHGHHLLRVVVRRDVTAAGQHHEVG